MASNNLAIRKPNAFEDALMKVPGPESKSNLIQLQQSALPIKNTAITQTPDRKNVVSLDPELLISKAIDANVPIEALERLLSMRAELKREQAQEAFSNALAGFQAHIPLISKSKTAKVMSKIGANYSYNYADIADIQRAIAPVMYTFGLSVTFDTAQNGDTLTVICFIHHINGHSEKATFPVPIDRQARMNDTQKVGSALTYGRRYALCAALGIVTAEDDDDGQASGHQPAPTPEPTPTPTLAPKSASGHQPAPTPKPMPTPTQSITEQQRKMLEAIIGKSGVDREWIKDQMFKIFQVRHFQDLNNRELTQLLEKIEKWKKIRDAKIKARDEEMERANPRNFGPDRSDDPDRECDCDIDITDCPF